MQTKPVSKQWILFFQWTFVNILGMTVSLTLVILGLLFHIVPIAADLILTVVVPSIILGLFQWFIVRSQIPNAKRWIGASFIGLALGASLIAGGSSLPVIGRMSDVNLGILAGAILGTTLGFSQWLILRQYVASSSLWVVATILGLSIGMAWGWLYLSDMSRTTDDIAKIFLFISIALIMVISIYSLFTGSLLVWLFSQSAKNGQATAA